MQPRPQILGIRVSSFLQQQWWQKYILLKCSVYHTNMQKCIWQEKQERCIQWEKQRKDLLWKKSKKYVKWGEKQNCVQRKKDLCLECGIIQIVLICPVWDFSNNKIWRVSWHFNVMGAESLGTFKNCRNTCGYTSSMNEWKKRTGNR